MRPPNAIRTFIVTGLALFMVTLDNLIVTNALPSIGEDLGAGLEGLEWTVNAYTLTFAVLLLPASALADRFGRRRVFTAGLALFTLASAAAALAPGTGALITARAVQGVGGAIVAPLTLTMLAAAVPTAKRGLALAGWSVMSGLGVALGPVVGGAVTEYASWQWIFWINVPVGIVLLALTPAFLAESRGGARRLDIPGTVLLSTGLVGVVLGLVRGNEHGWTSPAVLAGFLGGAALLAGFVVRELRTDAPMLPLALFRHRGFTIVNVVMLAMAFAIFGSAFLLIQYLQAVNHMSPLDAGVRTLPWTAMPLLAAPLTAPLAARFGARPILTAALACQAAGLAWTAAASGPGTAYAEYVPGFVLCGIGMGLFFAPVARLVLAFAPEKLSGVASGASNTFRQLGTVLGIAVLGAVFSANGDVTDPAAFTDGLHPALWTGAAVLAAAAALTLLLPRAEPHPAPAEPVRAAEPAAS
ncbi:Multidrug resistance protein stp [Actinomadura rubteroloni]|uniref:Multidrug resistance protein stp n=1 Tax=Actinomadura rubteroloni TaxID=1926885 RepID=A0A2P4UK41_9ACTN|nr:MFS transporter [Actinomadura rubteroloni]POM25432.1 Multidrug resistance protein stp [Actinomadura rubteroloni]